MQEHWDSEFTATDADETGCRPDGDAGDEAQRTAASERDVLPGVPRFASVFEDDGFRWSYPLNNCRSK
jgi:hypothetical protein